MERQCYPQWYQQIDVRESGIQGLVESGCILVLKDRDAWGRRVLITRPQHFDFSKYATTEAFRYGATILDHLQDEEITQVAGFVYIIDGSYTSPKFLSLMPLDELKIVFRSFQETCPLRLKHIFLINFNPLFVTIAEILTKLLSEKLRSRITFIKSVDEINKYIDPKILPKEYGGDVEVADIIQNFKNELEARRSMILGYMDSIKTNFTFLHSKHDCKNSDFAVVGSFRKLDID